MKLNKTFAALGFVGFLTMGARASLDYLYIGAGYADCSGQISIAYPTDYSGGVGYNSGMWVGQWNMEDPATHQTFTAFCLSPAGILSSYPIAFNPITPEAAKYGMNPSTWSRTGGIENAVYIWNQHSATITNNTEGAALSLAIWAALYNSTAVGNVTGSGRFSVSGTGFTSAMEAAFSSYLAEINAAGQSAVESVYNQNPATILRPVNTILQDLIDDPPGSTPGTPPSDPTPTPTPPSAPDPPPAPPSAPDPPPTPPVPGAASDPSMAPEPSPFFMLVALLATTGGKWLCALRKGARAKR